jgi:hypothetical protein
MNEKYPGIIEEYRDRLVRSSEELKGFKKKMLNAVKAYDQEIPDDIQYSASNEFLLKGNTSEKLPDTCSKMLLPLFTAISKKMIENLTALPPRYEWDANSKDFVTASRSLEKELAKCYTKMNIGRKNPRIIRDLVVKGMFVQQTVFKEMRDKVWKYEDGQKKVEELYNGGAVDFIVYEPINTFWDWDADITNLRNTSKFCIVTVSESMTKKGAEALFGEDVVAHAHGNMHGRYEDLMLDERRRDKGAIKPTGTYVVREYYKNDGTFYTVINDSLVVRKGYNSNGSADKIPINIGFMYNDLTTLWELVKWCIAGMSNAFNQVADNNAFNNTAPLFMLGDVALSAMGFDTNDGRKIYQIMPYAKTIVRAQDAIAQFTLPEVTEGAKFMYDLSKQSLFYVTGTNDMAFGIQDKQIRNQNVAEMIGESLVRADSDIAKKLETDLLNPITWDILMIYYTRYDSFSFNKETVPRDFLKDYRGIRVVNGSYLTSDKAVRLGKLQQALQLAQQIPERTNLEALFYDLYDAIGMADPYRYLKTNEEFVAQEMAGIIMQLLQTGAIDQTQADQMIASVKLVDEHKDQFQEQ